MAGLAAAKIVQVACGAAHSVALATDSRVYAWGWGNYGQLGMGLHSARTPQASRRPRPRPAPASLLLLRERPSPRALPGTCATRLLAAVAPRRRGRAA